MPRAKTGPYAPAADPVDAACAALARSVDPERVAEWYAPAAIRRRRLAALRAVLAEYDAEAALDRVVRRRMAS